MGSDNMTRWWTVKIQLDERPTISLIPLAFFWLSPNRSHSLIHSLSISNYNVNVVEWLFDRDDLNKKKQKKRVEFVMWSFHVSDYRRRRRFNLLFFRKNNFDTNLI